MRRACLLISLLVVIPHVLSAGEIEFLTKAGSPAMCRPNGSFENHIIQIDEAIATGRSPRCPFNHDIEFGPDYLGKVKQRNWSAQPFWAQEAIGSDLATEFLQSQSQSQVRVGVTDYFGSAKPRGQVDPAARRFGMVDRGKIRDHGDQVIDLIESPSYGGSRNVRWVFMNEMAGNGPLHLAQSNAKIVNGSVGVVDKTKSREIEDYIRGGGIFVKSTGNDYPETNPFGKMKDLIRVGALGPNGLAAPYSQTGATVMVPSDGIPSSENELFSGTSAAAPLVTSALTNVLSLMPNLTAKEATELINATELATFESRASHGEAPGMLNSYKLLRTAACLSSLTERERSTVSMDKRQPTKCFEFSQESNRFQKDALALLKSSNCAAQEQGLKKLRAAFLLAPNDKRAKQIANAYEKLGFDSTAKFYRGFLSEKSEQDRYFQSALRDTTRRESRYFAGVTATTTIEALPALAAVSRLPSSSPYFKKTFDFISSKATHSDGPIRKLAAEQASALGPRALPLLRTLMRDNDKSVSGAAAKGIRLMTMSQGPSLWADEANAFIKREGIGDAISQAYN